MEKTFSDYKNKRLAFSLSGGGAKGAYTVGVLKYLWEVKKTRKVKSIVGCSTGSLVGTMFGLSAITGESKYMVDLEYIYRNVIKDQVIKATQSIAEKLGGEVAVLALQAITGGSSIYDNSSLKDLIDQYVSEKDWRTVIRAGQRKTNPIEIGFRIVDATQGIAYTISNIIHPDVDMLRKGLIASTAIPIIMPPEELDGNQLVDGGVFDTNPIEAVLESPLYDKFDAIVSVTLSKLVIGPTSADLTEITEMLLRTIDLLSDQVIQYDLFRSYALNIFSYFRQELTPARWDKIVSQMPAHLKEILDGPTANNKYLPIFEIRPAKPLADGLEFEQPQMSNMVDQGFKEARKVFK